MRFGLAAAVRGAQAIDVGASTGASPRRCSRTAPRHVVARGRRPRSAAPVAARRSARDVAGGGRLEAPVAERRRGPLRLLRRRRQLRRRAQHAARRSPSGCAPGAQGVVLVKPQFELPDRQVKAAARRRPALRQAPSKRCAASAEALGFALVAQADSPVAGASGTIEVLAHLRFAGRPASLPQPGERRRAARKPPTPARRRARRASCAGSPSSRPGSRRSPSARWRRSPTRATSSPSPAASSGPGPPAIGLRANLWLRIATRVLARVGEVERASSASCADTPPGCPGRRSSPRGAPVAVRRQRQSAAAFFTPARWPRRRRWPSPMRSRARRWRRRTRNPTSPFC